MFNNFSVTGFSFAVEATYNGSNIILAIDSPSEGMFCCQLDIGTCINCESSNSNLLALFVAIIKAIEFHYYVCLGFLEYHMLFCECILIL